MKPLPIPNDPAGRTFDTVLIRDVIYAAEWDPETEQATAITDQDGDYIEVSADVLNYFFMTPQEVAEATSTSDSQWRNKAAAGKIPGAIMKGKQWLLPRSALKKLGVDIDRKEAKHIMSKTKKKDKKIVIRPDTGKLGKGERRTKIGGKQVIVRKDKDE